MAKENLYRDYVTEAGRIVTENTAKIAAVLGADGIRMSKRYVDILNPPPEEDRTADEIIHQVLHGLMEE